MIADPAELDWQVEERRGVNFYRIAPADHPATRARVERVVCALDAAGATIAVAPELCLSPALLDEWERRPAGTARRNRERASAVLVGTGNVTCPAAQQHRRAPRRPDG